MKNQLLGLEKEPIIFKSDTAISQKGEHVIGAERFWWSRRFGINLDWIQEALRGIDGREHLMKTEKFTSPTNTDIWRASNLLWSWASLSEFFLCTEFPEDWEKAQRYRRGARRILAWFKHHFGPDVPEISRPDPDLVKWLMGCLAEKIVEEGG